MDINNLKKVVEDIEMTDEMKKRIISNCYKKLEQNENIENKKIIKLPLKIAIVAAVISVFSTTVFAVVHLFDNPTIVENYEEMKEIQSKSNNTSSGVTSPISRTPHSFEEMAESSRFKSGNWTSKDNIGGSVIFGQEWNDMEVVETEDEVNCRKVYGTDGAVKTEYFSENPESLKSVETKYLNIDFSDLAQYYEYVPNANIFYVVEDKKGKYIGEYLSAFYSNKDKSSWFDISFEYVAKEQEYSNDFVMKESYDNLYKYKNTNGLEFVISTYGGCVWASCQTSHVYISLYGGYMSTEDIENVLDSVKMHILEG